MASANKVNFQEYFW